MLLHSAVPLHTARALLSLPSTFPERSYIIETLLAPIQLSFHPTFALLLAKQENIFDSKIDSVYLSCILKSVRRALPNKTKGSGPIISRA